ncbi:MAG TPA: hypothetical protein PLV72_04175 [Candidatus Magasanikbacteria bacterium]|nr:hypothetical protein [Candidatus Magasanikbacteria bacterium]
MNEDQKPTPAVDTNSIPTPDVSVIPAAVNISTSQITETNNPAIRKNSVINSALFPLIAFFLIGLVYMAVYAYLKPVATDIVNTTIAKIFKNYGMYFGWLFALISMIAMYVLYLVKKIVRLGKFQIVNSIILLASLMPWYMLADELLHHEKRYTDIGRGLITYVGAPLYWMVWIVAGFALLWFTVVLLVKLLKKKNLASKTILILFIITAPVLLTGCVGDIMGIVCDFLPDADHCLQGAAVQEGDDSGCEKISGEKFKDVGSNPPRDKCYLQIAENTGNLEACKKIKGGPMSYDKDECILNTALAYENPAGCKMLSGANKSKCLAEFGARTTYDKVLAVDDQIQTIKDYLKNGSDPDLEKQLKGLEEKRTDMLGVMTKNNRAEYERQSDPMNREIIGDFAVGEIDSATKEKLLAFNTSLKKQGLNLTSEQYEAFKDYYKFVNDPDNDIEKMKDSEIIKDRWNEKLGNVVEAMKFWKSNNTSAEEAADLQLRFYERMLERQAAIAQGMTELQQDVDRNMNMVIEAGKDKAKDILKDKVIEGLFGEITGKTVGWTTAVLGEAIDTVKAEAKSAEFRGLVGAYNSGMSEELGKFKGDVERAHAEVVKKLMADPYTYANGNSFAKYGNLIENKDCDGSNPHCLNKEVFWKAMKKSYKYQHGQTN